ncbi:MAG: hypothetical protein J6A59_13290 [Lachnospiraceae bacterium]|nr:hypothetical protein [Lachnospiraceae bacterium]
MQIIMRPTMHRGAFSSEYILRNFDYTVFMKCGNKFIAVINSLYDISCASVACIHEEVKLPIYKQQLNLMLGKGYNQTVIRPRYYPITILDNNEIKKHRFELYEVL